MTIRKRVVLEKDTARNLNLQRKLRSSYIFFCTHAPRMCVLPGVDIMIMGLSYLYSTAGFVERWILPAPV